MRFRPCIDIHDGKVKQIVGGSLGSGEKGPVENYVADLDASYFSAMFRDDRLKGGHVIMLGPGNETQAIAALNTFPGGLQVGGGITADNASVYLENGASHVIVTSYVFHDGEVDWTRLESLTERIGKSRLVLDLSCRLISDSFFVATDRWSRLSKIRVNETTLSEFARYCDEFLVHAVDVEGLRRGIDIELIELLARYDGVPVTYAGGVRTLDDLELINELGKGRIDATVGSALDIYGGDLPYRDIIKWQNKHENPD